MPSPQVAQQQHNRQTIGARADERGVPYELKLLLLLLLLLLLQLLQLLLLLLLAASLPFPG